jgi:outer membrane protein assembly factor BamE (lipoprotein component of BamABCDE complex)
MAKFILSIGREPVMKSALILCMSLLLFSCVTQTYNTPFINSDETVKLEFGMTQDRVMELLNSPPLFVASGDAETVVWVYEVRTIEVKSKLGSSGQTAPSKTSSYIKHAAPVHRLALVFDSDGKLMDWGPHGG